MAHDAKIINAPSLYYGVANALKMQRIADNISAVSAAVLDQSKNLIPDSHPPYQLRSHTLGALCVATTQSAGKGIGAH